MLTIHQRAGEDGKLFGSVGTVDIAEAVYYMVEGRSFTERRGAEAPGIMTFALEASR